MWKYFKDLERTMSVRGLNDLAIEMAELYANSAAITKADLAQENDMTVKLVSELLDGKRSNSWSDGKKITFKSKKALTRGGKFFSKTSLCRTS